MIRSIRLSPGFRPIEWLIAAAILIPVMLVSCQQGMDALVREAEIRAVRAAEQQEADFRRCLDGNTVDVRRPGCRIVAERIRTSADAAEHQFNQGETQ